MFKIYTFLFVCLFLCSTVLADDRTMLSINGVGTVKASPDMATVSVGVVTQEVTPELALKVNSDSVSKILADLKAANIEEKDVETSSFSIQPKYEYDDNKQIFKGYVVVNQVIVCVRDLDNLGSVLTSVVKSGANNINSLTYSSSKAKDYLNEARKLAVADAKEKAALYAKEFDMKLGKLVVASESVGSVRSNVYMRSAASDGVGGTNAVPVSSGELEFTINLSVQYVLE